MDGESTELAEFVVGLAHGFYDASGTHIFRALRSSFLDLPAGTRLVEVDNEGGPLLPEHLAGIDAFVMLGGRVNEASLVGHDRLAVIARWGVGYDTVDIDACARSGVVVANAPEGVKKAMAHTAIGFVLSLAHQIPAQDRAMRNGNDWSTRTQHIGPGLVGKTLGVVGLGNIGRQIVSIAKVLDCEVIGYDPYAPANSVDIERVELDDLMRRSDYIILQCALTPESRGLISRERLAMMKPTAFLINTARGPVVDEPALIDALRTGAIAGAALDVFETEPLPNDSPLLTMDNVILTPHSAGWTDYFAQATADSVSGAIRAVHGGELPVNTVNRAQLEASGLNPRYLRYRA